MAAIASEIDLSNANERHFLNEFVPQERIELDKKQFCKPSDVPRAYGTQVMGTTRIGR